MYINKFIPVILLILCVVGCTQEDSPDGLPLKWAVRENEREDRVQALVEQLSDEVESVRQAAYSELRDNAVRKRDIPTLKRFAEGAHPNSKNSLVRIIGYIEAKRRMPEKGWTSNLEEWENAYREQFDDLGGIAAPYRTDYRPLITHWEILDLPSDEVKFTDAICLIHNLEPESLSLWDIEDISFLGLLSNLKELTLSSIQINDLTPLQELNLEALSIKDSQIGNLGALQNISSLRELHLINVPVSERDLRLLKGLNNLETLRIENHHHKTGTDKLSPPSDKNPLGDGE